MDPHNIKIPDYNVVASVLPGSVNVLRLALHPREGDKATVIGDYPFLPNQDTRVFLMFCLAGAEAAAHTAAGFLKPGHSVGIDEKKIIGVCDAIVRAVMKVAQSAILGPDGKSQIRVAEGGVIPGDIRSILGQDNGIEPK